MNTPVILAGAVILMLAELCYGYRQFHAVGCKYNIDLCDAFWLSTCVNAFLSLVFLSVLTWYGWRHIDCFSAVPYAYLPLAAAFVYCCALGATICIIRLKMNHWIGTTSKAQTWCFLLSAIFLIIYTACEISSMYLGWKIPEAVYHTIGVILWCSIIGIPICGYRLTVLNKD